MRDGPPWTRHSRKCDEQREEKQTRWHTRRGTEDARGTVNLFFFFLKTDAYDSPASARSSARSRSASTMANLRATCINDTYTRFLLMFRFVYPSLSPPRSPRLSSFSRFLGSPASGPRSTISRRSRTVRGQDTTAAGRVLALRGDIPPPYAA